MSAPKCHNGYNNNWTWQCLSKTKYLQIGIYCLLNLTYFYEFIGRMGTLGLPRTELERREGHQSLITECG